MLVKTLGFFSCLLCGFYSLLGLSCKTVELAYSCRYIDSISLSISNISSGFRFNILWNNHGTNLSSSFLWFPAEVMKSAIFKVVLGETATQLLGGDL